MNCETIEGLSNSADFLQQSLPGVSLGVLKQRYSEVLIDFAVKTEIWRYVFEHLPVFTDTKQYELDAVEGQAVARIARVFVADGCACEPEYTIPEGQGVSRGRYRGGSINANQNTEYSDLWWYSPEPNKLMFSQCFEEDGCLRLELVLRPERGTTNFPAGLLDKYKEVIEFGVLAKAMMMPNQQWSDIKFAQHYKAEYEHGMLEPKRKHKMNMLAGRPAYRRSV